MSDNIYIEFADGSFLASLDPMPLFPEEEALYDGQPRKADGRFDFGRRIDVARTNGLLAPITVSEGRKILEQTTIVSDLKGSKVKFSKRLWEKYGLGIGRPGGKDAARLMQLGKALYVVQHATETDTVELPCHNPPQVQYIWKLGEKEAIAVYVEKDSREVRGITYTAHQNADKFLAKRKGR